MEEWRPVVDFPEYQVSNLGRVKSNLKWRGTDERILIPKKHNAGYHIVCLRKEGKNYYQLIHRLVALAFLPFEKKQVVDHINRNKKDNRLNNLRWTSSSLNNINKADQTNHRYIYETTTSYQCRINNQQIKISKNFESLEEALEYRDTILNQTSFPSFS